MAGQQSDVVRSFWHGSDLSPYETLSLTSFVDYGHRVELYSFDRSLQVPRGVELRDASEILPESKIYFYASGPGRGSVSAFANLFRYVLLRQKGGWWIDTDVLCLSSRLPAVDRFFAWEDESQAVIGAAVLKFPANDRVLRQCLADASAFRPNVAWGTTGPYLLTASIKHQELVHEAQHFSTAYPWHHARTFDVFDPDRRDEIAASVKTAHFQHLWHENFRRCGIIKSLRPPAGSYLDEAFNRHSVAFPAHPAYDYAAVARAADLYEKSVFADNIRAMTEILPKTLLGTLRSARRSWLRWQAARSPIT